MLFNYHVKETFEQCAFSSTKKREKKKKWKKGCGKHSVEITPLPQKLAL